MLQTVEIIGGAKTYCDRLDITIDFYSGAVGDKFSMMCRRQPIDFCDVSFDFGASEEVISDVITYRVQRKGRKTLCIFTVPIYCKPLSTEEVVLKSNEGHALIVSKVFEKDKVRLSLCSACIHLTCIVLKINLICKFGRFSVSGILYMYAEHCRTLLIS